MLKQIVDPGKGDCPFCKEPVALEATRCPHCTSELGENEAWLAQKQRQTNAGCASMLCVVVVVAGVAGLFLLF